MAAVAIVCVYVDQGIGVDTRYVITMLPVSLSNDLSLSRTNCLSLSVCVCVCVLLCAYVCYLNSWDTCVLCMCITQLVRMTAATTARAMR